jgi:hypothetical protein
MNRVHISKRTAAGLGYSLAHPLQICQAPEILEQFTRVHPFFHYDLHDAEFVAYFESRTGYRITQCDCGWPFVRDVLAAPWFSEAYPDPVWMLTRAKLQDAWEIWETLRTPPTVKESLTLAQPLQLAFDF